MQSAVQNRKAKAFEGSVSPAISGMGSYIVPLGQPRLNSGYDNAVKGGMSLPYDDPRQDEGELKGIRKVKNDEEKLLAFICGFFIH